MEPSDVIGEHKYNLKHGNLFITLAHDDSLGFGRKTGVILSGFNLYISANALNLQLNSEYEKSISESK